MCLSPLGSGTGVVGRIMKIQRAISTYEQVGIVAIRMDRDLSKRSGRTPLRHAPRTGRGWATRSRFALDLTVTVTPILNAL